MKIVILSDGFPPISLGGAESIAYSLAYELGSRGYEVSVITTTKNMGDIGTFKERNITVYRLYSDYDNRFRAYLSLYNRRILKEVSGIIKSIKPDIVHVHNIHTHLSYASLKIAKQYSKAVFLTLHDFMSIHYGKLGARVDSFGNIILDSINPLKQLFQYRFAYNPFRNILIRYYLGYVDKIFSVSESQKNILENKGIKPIEVLHNGIDTSNWSVDEKVLKSFRQKYNLENKKVLFFGGRLSSSKGGSVIVDVLKKVSSVVDNVVLLVVGEKNKSVEAMLDKAEKLGISKNIIFTGWVANNDMKYAYSSSDLVFVLSQYIDPFPTINLEAMASKRPVIGTIFGGTAEVVLDNKTGYVVNPRDTDSISEKVIDLLKDKEKLNSFGLSGYNRVSEFFSAKAWVDKIVLCYAEILRNKK